MTFIAAIPAIVWILAIVAAGLIGAFVALKARGSSEGETSEDEPLISFVLFQRSQKYLEDVTLTKIIQSAWGGEYASGEDSEGSEEVGFVVGESPIFCVKTPNQGPLFLVHNHDQPYFDDMDEVLSQVPDLRLRKAIADHTAWLAVDLVGASGLESGPDGEVDAAEFYPQIMKLICELADDETLAIFQPASNNINVWSEELADKLLDPNAYESFAEPTNVPVIPISDDDPELLASVEKAKETWPQFVAAFQEQPDDCSDFGVKVKLTEQGETEFIWLEVIGLEPRYVHGTLANDPVALGDLKLGSQVEVPLEDVQDWCYMKDGEPIGLYSLAAIEKAQARLAEE